MLFACLMVLNATFNNISVISWCSVLFQEETGVPGDNHRPFSSKHCYFVCDNAILEFDNTYVVSVINLVKSASLLHDNQSTDIK